MQFLNPFFAYGVFKFDVLRKDMRFYLPLEIVMFPLYIVRNVCNYGVDFNIKCSLNFKVLFLSCGSLLKRCS